MVIGAAATGLAVACAALALRSSSRVERRLNWVRARPARPAAASHLRDLMLVKVVVSFAAALAGCVVAAAFGLGVAPVVVAAYLGLILPSVVVERGDASRRRDAERAVVTLVEWLHALVASGRPIETALVGLASRGRGSGRVLDGCLERVGRDYLLGVPLHDALAHEGRTSRVRGLVDLAERLERARGLGRAVLPVLQELRDELRATERARGLRAASQVEGKLTLVLTLCYLPALALLVIIPLFLTLLAGLFG